MNCAVYIRKSREDKNKAAHRLTVQREQLPRYGEDQGWQVNVYDDGHASAARGRADQLPERSRLERDIKTGVINIVLVIELSRFSRDDTLQDYIAWLTLCSDHGVKLATMQRILDPCQHSDWMLLLMEGGFSSVEMKIIRSRMEEGRAQAYRSGKFLGGRPPKPYRYTKATSRPEVDRDLLAETERVWTLIESHSAKAVAEMVGWPEIAVRRCVSDNRLLFYQAIRFDKVSGEQIRCNWDPVMTGQRADRIRQARRTRKTNGQKREAAGRLSNLNILRCGYCGRTVKSWRNSRIRLDGSRLDYYGCQVKGRKNACPKSRLIQHLVLEERVLTNLFNTLALGDRLEQFWRVRETEQKKTSLPGQLDQELTDLQEQKKRLIEAVATGIMDLQDIKEKHDTIKERIAGIELEMSEQQRPKEPDWDQLNLPRSDFDLLNFTGQREVIRATIRNITIFENYALIEYPFPRSETGSATARIHLPPPIKGPRATKRNSLKVRKKINKSGKG